MAQKICVLGLGGVGSAVVWRMSQLGYEVIGIDKHTPVHDRGSSHGQTRAIRKAYFEDQRYIPWMKEAYKLWEGLEAQSGESLFIRKGVLLGGAPDSEILKASQSFSQKENIHIEIWPPHEMKRQCPDFHWPEGFYGVYEKDAGYLMVEESLKQFQSLSQKEGAQLFFEEKIESLRFEKNQVLVKTNKQEIWCDQVVSCLGAWTSKLFPEYEKLIEPLRVVQYWFQGGEYADLPVFFQDTPQGPWMYGFPALGGKVKLAFHNVSENCDPDRMNREVAVDEIDLMGKCARQLLPELGEFETAKTCIYSMTKDEHFILEPHRHDPRVFIIAGLSGHGFKFAPFFGELVHKWIQNDQGQENLKFFSSSRL